MRAPPGGSPPRDWAARRSRTRSRRPIRAAPPALLADHWLELLLDGQDPEAVIAAADAPGSDARLAVAAASACLTLGDPAAAAARLDVVRERGGTEETAQLAALLSARARRDLPGAREAAGELLRGGGAGRSGDAQRALALFHLGAAEFAGGGLAAAAEQLEGAAAIAVERGRERLLLGCPGAGRRSRSPTAGCGARARAARAALALAEPRGWHHTAPAAWAYAALAATHWHRDELDDAERRADAAAAAALRVARGGRRLAVARVARAPRRRARRRSAARAGCSTPCTTRCRAPARWPRAGSMRSARRRGRRRRRRADRRGRGSARRAATRSRRCGASSGCPTAARDCARRGSAARLAARRARAPGAGPAGRRVGGRSSTRSRWRRRGLPAARSSPALPSRRLLERQRRAPDRLRPVRGGAARRARAADGGATPGLLEPLCERERAVLRLLPTLLSYPRDRGRAVRLRQHGQDPRQEHLPQARRHEPPGGRRARPRAAADLGRRLQDDPPLRRALDPPAGVQQRHGAPRRPQLEQVAVVRTVRVAGLPGVVDRLPSGPTRRRRSAAGTTPRRRRGTTRGGPSASSGGGPEL